MGLLFSRRYRNYLFLVPLFVAVLFHQIVYTVVALQHEARKTKIVLDPFSAYSDAVSEVSQPARNAGVRTGDRILSLDGHKLIGSRDFYNALRRHRPGDQLIVQVIPKGQKQSRAIRVPLSAESVRPNSYYDWIVVSLILLLMLLCVAVGIYAAAVLPNDLRALSLFGVLVGTARMVNVVDSPHFPASLWAFAVVLSLASRFSWGIWLLCFALYFPERFAWDIKRPWLKWLFLGPFSLWTLLIVIDWSASFFDFHAFPALERLLSFGGPNLILLWALPLALFFIALGSKAGTASRDARRRLRILLAGSLVSLLPLACLFAYQVITQHLIFNGPSQWVVISAILLFFLFPITLAYVILVERAMDLRMVIRQGVRYTLAKGGLRVLASALAIAVGFAANSALFATKLSEGTKTTISIVIGILIFFLVRKTRSWMMLWVDRRFFREAYNAQMILEDLGESVHSITDEQQLLDTVARRISDTLHVPRFAVLLNGNGILKPVYCLGFEPRTPLALAEESKTVETIKRAKDPPQIYFDRQDNWVHSTPENELVTLRAMHAQLLLPVGSKDRLLGLLSLGPKLSEEPYTKSDVQLLRSVAVQTALALENTRLTKAVATEMAQREKLNREIEIAREVQERLFPQRLPAIAGIDYSGACRPALGVGGDYYDFLPLANGDLGVAIGDVSGKGIAAALLMASLQASLRGQAMVGQGDLARLIANVNQLVYDATPSNRYATFFYGQYHRQTHTLRYVNAGHNAPVVLRQTGVGAIHVIRLDTGGPVIGLFPNAPYQEGSLQMEPGDIFIGFTDGISEAMNPQEEEWGEERLIPAIAALTDRSAAEIIPALMSEADRFAAGAPQHDDMTLVVLKMSS